MAVISGVLLARGRRVVATRIQLEKRYPEAPLAPNKPLHQSQTTTDEASM